MPERDAAERAQLLRIAVLLGPPLLIIGAFTIFFVCRRFELPRAFCLIALAALPLLTWCAILLVEASTARAAQGIVSTLHAANIPPSPAGFSRQEALAARGKFAEAAEGYRAHLAEQPGDVAALVALGRLLAGPLADPDAAAAAYLAARRLKPGPGWERIIVNDMIDLASRTADAGRLMGELSRFAALSQGTRAGEAAAARLRKLKEEARISDEQV